MTRAKRSVLLLRYGIKFDDPPPGGIGADRLHHEASRLIGLGRLHGKATDCTGHNFWLKGPAGSGATAG